MRATFYVSYLILELQLMISNETPWSYRPFEILRLRPSSTAFILWLSCTMSIGISISICTSRIIFFVLTIADSCIKLKTLFQSYIIIENVYCTLTQILVYVSKRHFLKDVRRRKRYDALPKKRGSPFRSR